MEQAAPLSTPPLGEGRGTRKWQQRPLCAAFRVELWKRLQQLGDGGAVRLQRPRVPELLQGRTKFAASGPAPAERCCGPARRVRGDPPRPMLHRQTGACRENFEKLLRRNRLLQLASRGPREELV